MSEGTGRGLGGRRCPGRIARVIRVWSRILNPGGGVQRNGQDQMQERYLAMGVIGKGVLWGPLLVSLCPPCPAGPQPRCGCLPPLPHEQGAGAEGGEAGAAGAGIGVWRPRAGPGLCACLPGHPQGLCVHRPCAGPSPATTTTAPASRVSTHRKSPCSHPQTLTWVLDQAFPSPKHPPSLPLHLMGELLFPG